MNNYTVNQNNTEQYTIIWSSFMLTGFFFCLFRTTPAAYGSFQARGPIRAVATGLCHSHSNGGIQATSMTYTTAHSKAGLFNPLSEARDGNRILMDASHVH